MNPVSLHLTYDRNMSRCYYMLLVNTIMVITFH